MAYTTLEDFFGDIVGKARRGQAIEMSQITQETGLSETQLSQIESYDFIPEADQIQSLANILNLNGEKLVSIADGWMPTDPNITFENDHMRVERLVLDAGMTVNCYVLVCKQTGNGAVIDPGGEAQRIEHAIADLDVTITHILLTHGHGDHVGALNQIAQSTKALVCGCDRDFSLMGERSQVVSERVDEGWKTQVGNLGIEAFALAGHTAGGIGYYTAPVIFSGDALFAGSLGGARGQAYTGQIAAVQECVLSLPGDTRIFPGHGPLTTVDQEIKNNPYFL